MIHPLQLIPGRIIGYLGAMGSGKSSQMTAHVFELAECMKAEFLVFNYSLDTIGLWNYFSLTGNSWCLRLLMNNRIICRNIPLDASANRYVVEDFFIERNAIYAIDEAGIIFGCRSWQSISKAFLSDMAQLRHHKRFLFWAAQSIDQVDKQFKALSTGYVWCCGMSRYSSELQAPEQMVKFNRLYLSADYEKLIANGRLSTSGFKAVLQSTLRAKKTWLGILNKVDRAIFTCYPSFDTVGDGAILVGNIPKFVPKIVSFSEQDFNRRFTDEIS